MVDQNISMSSGATMPSLGLGTFLGNGSEIKSAVDYALSIGYRHIDTAYTYDNHAAIGEILHENIIQGKVRREEVFLTTKIPPDQIGSERTINNFISESLESLKTPYVDMLLIHYPFATLEELPWSKPNITFIQPDFAATWKHLEKYVESGHVRAIGLSNFNQNQIEQIMQTANIKPANIQMECHAYLQQKELRDYCHKHGIVVTGFCPLGCPGRPDHLRESGDKELLADPVLLELAKNLGKSPAQILIRFLMQLGVVPLPKSVTPYRIKENLECYNFSLDARVMEILSGLDCGQRYFKFRWAQGHPEFFQREAF